MGFWVMLAVMIGMSVVSYLLTPKIKLRTDKSRPLGLDEFSLPTAEEGRALPVVFGTVNVKGVNVLGQYHFAQWYSEGTGLWYYWLAVHFGVSARVDSINSMMIQEKIVPMAGVVVTDGNNKIVFRIAGFDYTAPIATGTYPSRAALAEAVEAAMLATDPGAAGWWVRHSYVVSEGRSTIFFIITINSIPNYCAASLTPGKYTAAAFFAEAERAMNAAVDPATEGVFSVHTDGSMHFVKAAGSLYQSFELQNIDYATNPADFLSSILPMLGYHSYDYYVGTGAGSVSPEISTHLDRFIWNYGYSTPAVLRTSLASFTARALLGLPVSDVDVTVALSTADRLNGLVLTDGANGHTTVEVRDSSGLVQGQVLDATFEFYNGDPAQEADAYLAAAIGSTIPAYRRTAHAMLKQTLIGSTGVPWVPSFVVQWNPNSLGLPESKHHVGGDGSPRDGSDANPVAAIYELLTNADWGLGLPPSSVDVANFLQIGAALYDEACGVSMPLESADRAAEYIADILRVIDGVLYVDASTGLAKIALVRADYSLAGIPALTQDNVLSCSLTRSSWDDTRNVVRVRYKDKNAGYTERVEMAQDLANILTRGGEQSIEDYAFPGVTSATQAASVAARLLKAVSTPLAQITLTVNLQGWSLRPGSVFKLTWAPLGIEDMACRVANVRVGRATENTLEIDAVEDIFGLPWTNYTPGVGYGYDYGNDYGGTP